MLDFACRYTAAWCSQDAGRVAAFYSPDGSLGINGGPPAMGPAAITEAVQSFMTSFPDMRVRMDEVRVRSDCTEYHWTLTGTNTGPGGAGHRVHISGYEQWQIAADGLIGSSLGHFDAADYQRQLACRAGEKG